MITPLAIRIARKYRILDTPGSAPHKSHNLETPLAGGIVLVIILGGIYFLFGRYFAESTWKILITTLIVAIFGIFDDSKKLDFRVKLLGQLLAAGLLIGLGVQINIIRFAMGPFSPAILNEDKER